MPKYLIRWNAGWGEGYDVVEAETIDVAEEIAEQSRIEEAESNGFSRADILTKENAENYGFEDELEEE